MANMSQFGELVLLIGDTHIPQRTVEVPAKFKEMLVPGKVQHVLCTGNLGNRETWDWVNTLSASVHTVRGDFDTDLSLPESKTVTIGDWRVALVHGHQVIPWTDQEALANMARQFDCDILVSGHTHVNRVESMDGKYYINPGSATGAYSPICAEAVPSFILMAFQGRVSTVYVYQLVDEKVTVNKTEIAKN